MYVAYILLRFITDDWHPYDSHAKLKVAAIRAIGCLIQNHQGELNLIVFRFQIRISENQNFMLEKDLDETLVRLMATGGLTNDPVLQTWATYWQEITLIYVCSNGFLACGY